MMRQVDSTHQRMLDLMVRGAAIQKQDCLNAPFKSGIPSPSSHVHVLAGWGGECSL